MATQSSTPTVMRDIVECPICLETLTEPRMLACFHFYCQKCVADMKQVQQAEAVGYECPLCRTFTASDEPKSLPIMNQLMEALQAASTDVKTCERCNKGSIKWRCLDCKDNFCSECRQLHDSFKLFRAHRIEAIGDSGKPVIDDIVFCQVHSSEQVKLHCRDCKKLICILCNLTTHKTHSVETIEEALQQILPVVKDNQVKVKALIEQTKHSISDGKTQKDDITAMYDDVSKDIDAKYALWVKRLNEDRAALLKELDISKEKSICQVETRVKQLEQKLHSQENVLSLSQSTLDTAQNISLLKALQSGVLDSLNGALNGSEKNPKRPRFEVSFDEKTPGEENQLGVLRESHPHSDDILAASGTKCSHSMWKILLMEV